MTLSPGHPAPDIVLPDDSGEEVRISDVWEKHPLVLLFVRHFG
jgi:peroxiredoxin